MIIIITIIATFGGRRMQISFCTSVSTIYCILIERFLLFIFFKQKKLTFELKIGDDDDERESLIFCFASIN